MNSLYALSLHRDILRSWHLWVLCDLVYLHMLLKLQGDDCVAIVRCLHIAIPEDIDSMSHFSFLNLMASFLCLLHSFDHSVLRFACNIFTCIHSSLYFRWEFVWVYSSHFRPGSLYRKCRYPVSSTTVALKTWTISYLTRVWLVVFEAYFRSHVWCSDYAAPLLVWVAANVWLVPGHSHICILDESVELLPVS